METVKFKDVAHLYLGCEMQCMKVDEDINTFGIKAGDVGKLTYINHGIMELTATSEDGDSESENWNWGIEFDRCNFACWDNDRLFKPILRPLSSMTTEECIDVYHIDADNALHHATNDFDIRRALDAWIITRLDHMDTNLFISDTGQIWKTTDTLEIPRSQSVIFSYLLSKSFDLFSLLESGEAIHK